MSAFTQAIEKLDTSLFQAVPSQTSDADRRSLLAVQREIRKEPYAYLEIGSHLGGTIQPHYADPACQRIYSIDKRPRCQPDERGERFEYKENSTATMLDNLRRAFPDVASDKITTFDADAAEVPPQEIMPPPGMNDKMVGQRILFLPACRNQCRIAFIHVLGIPCSDYAVARQGMSARMRIVQAQQTGDQVRTGGRPSRGRHRQAFLDAGPIRSAQQFLHHVIVLRQDARPNRRQSPNAAARLARKTRCGAQRAAA